MAKIYFNIIENKGLPPACYRQVKFVAEKSKKINIYDPT